MMNLQKKHLSLRAGLTVVELVIGMTITAMVGAAVAAFFTSVSEGWTHNAHVQTQTSLAA